MLFLKRIVTVLALVYLLLVLLLLLFPAVRYSVAVLSEGANSTEMERNFLLGFTWAGAGAVALLLLVENLDSGLLRRRVGKQEQKINELKAQLFDAQRPRTVPPAAYPPPPGQPRPPGVAYPPADPARRPGPPPNFPTPPPTTY